MKQMVLLHGWGTHPVIWQPLLNRLAHATALPLPGYAGSAPALGLDGMVEHILPQVEEQSTLVGWSLGGLVAMRMAMLYPHKFDKLVLIGATPCFVNKSDWTHGVDDTVFEQFADSLAQDYAGTIRRFLSLQAQGSEALKTVLGELRRKLLSLPPPEMSVLQSGLSVLRTTDLRQQLRELRLPVALIHGVGDKLAPVAAARWMAGQIPGARLHEVPGAAHAPFLSHAEAVAELIHG